jgi:hypothetical protein
VTALRFFSYGGGVQSTAALVLAARGEIDFPHFVMANVGDDSEHPATLAYVRDVAMPYAAGHGIDLHLLDRTKRDGTVETLWGRLMDSRPCPDCDGVPSPDQEAGCPWCEGRGNRNVLDWPDGVDFDELDDDYEPPMRWGKCPNCDGKGYRMVPGCSRCGGTGRLESRSLPIPVRMSNGAPGQRSCTADFKIRVTGKWAKQHGATKDTPAVVGIGISVDEIHRANNRRVEAHEQIVYPLLDLRLRRDDCLRIIAEEGLPVPGKSSCFFCPFHRTTAWQDLARETPDLFEKSCQLEDTLNARRDTLGKDHVFLTRFGVPLRQAIALDQDTLPADPADGECGSGWCGL